MSGGDGAQRGPAQTGREEAERQDRLQRRAVSLDLLRANLYRILDELARSGQGHAELVRSFERSWERYKDLTGGPR